MRFRKYYHGTRLCFLRESTLEGSFNEFIKAYLKSEISDSVHIRDFLSLKKCNNSLSITLLVHQRSVARLGVAYFTDPTSR